MSDNQQIAGANACRARVVENMGLVECMAEALHCSWFIPHGERKYCGHPCNNLIADGIPHKNWPAGAPKVG